MLPLTEGCRAVTRTRLCLLATLGVLSALPDYTGYSGAPGASGFCAGSCHGSAGGTITVAGFPVSYAPGNVYVVLIGHVGGASISNFNASIRIGTGSQTAGTITAGLNTATYSRAEEPNGVHLSGSNRDSCTFNWTAPAAGTGPVRLYVAGLQGFSAGGPNTALTLTATEGPGIGEAEVMPDPVALDLRPSIVADRVVMRVSGRQSPPVRISVIDASGRLVARFDDVAVNAAVVWYPSLPAGDYFAVLNSGDRRLARRFAIKPN